MCHKNQKMSKMEEKLDKKLDTKLEPIHKKLDLIQLDIIEFKERQDVHEMLLKIYGEKLKKIS